MQIRQIALVWWCGVLGDIVRWLKETSEVRRARNHACMGETVQQSYQYLTVEAI
jgi:hypothetical protein